MLSAGKFESPVALLRPIYSEGYVFEFGPVADGRAMVTAFLCAGTNQKKMQLWKVIFLGGNSVQYKFVTYLIAALTLNLFGCGEADLSRNDAAKVIAESPIMQKYRANVLLQKDAVEIGETLGWWNKLNGWGAGIGNVTPILAEEVTTFKGLDFSRKDIKPNHFELKNEVTIDVAVTGITGKKETAHRAVEFEWRYPQLPPLIKRLATQGGSGLAIFRLYDDGWRLVEVTNEVLSESPYPLSEEEKQSFASDISSENARRAAAQEAAENAKRAFAERLSLSRTPTREFGSYTFEGHSATWGNTLVNVKVSDVGLQIETRDRSGTELKEVRFSQIARPDDAAGYDTADNLIIAGRFLSNKRSDKGSPDQMAAINGINKAFSEWKTTYADVVEGCASYRTWGCDR